MVLCMIFAHDFLDTMVFCPWYWTRCFLVHGIRRDVFRSMVLDASTCINMYCNIERNIMKNQAGSPGFGIQGKNLCAYVSYVFSNFTM